MSQSKEWARLDVQASAQKKKSYRDPKTGYHVFSTYGLLFRKDCCGCGCRHCPFGYVHVPEAKRHLFEKNPWIEFNTPEHRHVDVVSWSGGKDSYLALCDLQKERKRSVVLLNTFDGRTEKVAHQDVTLSMIRKQAESLALPLLFIPLYPHVPYLTRISQGLSLIAQYHTVHRLVFGDLHLQHVREWREKELEPICKQYRISLHFPLWQVDYQTLHARLREAPVECRISAIDHAECEKTFLVGDLYNEDLISKLPKGVDSFGENGEFHTYVSIS